MIVVWSKKKIRFRNPAAHFSSVFTSFFANQLMQSCGNEWSTGYPHKAIGLVLDESSSTGQGGGEIADASVLVNLVEICNTEM